ncbi:hypothetical protein [uncultured Capnocytophaga sp.]|uniref:hypothetical protein n=1 Tax=uncultured Capnocytophaga sp. TaxID=159273 RepID=UPI0026057A2B|nr:hypothetical protein [uncultured Capnocytophaga sp.]
MEKMFYLISDPSQNIPEADNNWIEELKNKEIICSCGNVISSSPIDIYLSEKFRKNFAPLTAVIVVNIQMLRKDLMSILEINNIEKMFFIGDVYDVNKKKSEDYISMVPKKVVPIRGGKESSCKRCEQCGRVMYFPLPLNNWYILKNDIPICPYFLALFMGLL